MEEGMSEQWTAEEQGRSKDGVSKKGIIYFRLHNRVSGPEIVYLGGLNGPLRPQNPLENVGGEAFHLFRCVLR